MVKVAVVAALFPQASVAVKETVAAPVAPQESETEVKLLVQVTEEQVSLAEAPPLEANQAFKASVFPLPSHCTSKLEACTEITGFVVSMMVKVAVVAALFPQASVAVKETVAAPVAPQESETEVKLLVQVTEEQVSLAEAPPLEANQAFKASVFPLPSHCTSKLEACTEITGFVVSMMVNIWVKVSDVHDVNTVNVLVTTIGQLPFELSI